MPADLQRYEIRNVATSLTGSTSRTKYEEEEMTAEQTEQYSWRDSNQIESRTTDRTRLARRVRGNALWQLTRKTVVLLVLLPIIGGLIGLAFAALTPARYTSHAYLLVIETGQGAGVSAINVAQATARIATKPSVLDTGKDGATLLSAVRAGGLSATASPDAPLVDLAATASTADDSVRLANEMSSRVKEHVNGFSDAAGVRLEVFALASRPDKPTSPNILVDVLAGFALGSLAAAVLFVLKRRS